MALSAPGLTTASRKPALKCVADRPPRLAVRVSPEADEHESEEAEQE